MLRPLLVAALVASCSAFTATPASLHGIRLRSTAQASRPAALGQPLSAAHRLGGARATQHTTALRMSSIDVSMPALSSTMKEGKIVQWAKAEGDKVSAGDVLMVVESDKADMDVEAFEDGYLAKILVPEGEAAAVGATVAVLAEKEADISAVAASAGSGGAAAAAPAAAEAAAPAAGGAPYDGPSITMPALSSTMKEGKIVQWAMKEGDKVSAGDVVMVVESDKADMDVEAFEDGFIAKILVPEGEAAAVGAPVALLAEKKEDIEKVAASYVPSAATAAPAAAAPAPAAPAPPKPAAAPATPAPKAGGSGFSLPSGVVSASPQAKKAAKANGIDLSTVQGSGLGGRITEDDVLAAAGKAQSSAPAPAAGGRVSMRDVPELPDGPKPLSGMQAAVAKNMEATMAAPSFQVSRSIRTDKFDELYAALKPKGVTVSALLSKAVALTLEKHPIINAGYDPVSKSILYKRNINIANAVAIDGGLITPVLKNANTMDILSLSAQWKDLVGKAKTGSLKPDEYSTGTVTISNLGMFGVSKFGSLLPSGTGSILAISAALPTVVMKNGKPEEVKKMEVTITADHRHIYGADAALFLKDLADILENNTAEILL